MAKCDIQLHFENKDATFRPGEEIRGEVEVAVSKNCTCSTVLLARRCVIEGSVEATVVPSETILEVPGGDLFAGETYFFPFSFRVPEAAPLSFQGKRFRVTWLLDAEATLAWAVDPTFSWPFQIQMAPAPERLMDQDPANQPLEKEFHSTSMSCLGISMLIICMLTAMLGSAGVLYLLQSSLEKSGIGPGMGLVAFVLISLAFLGIFAAPILMHQWFAKKRVGAYTVDITPAPTGPGEVLSVVVRCKKKATALREIRCELRAIEKITSFSDESDIERTLFCQGFRRQLDARSERSASPESHFQFLVPGDAHPGFQFGDCSVYWEVVLLFQIRGLHAFKEVMPVKVVRNQHPGEA